MADKVLILGGYGNAGMPIARLLLQHSDVQLVLAGRDQQRAQQTARLLNAEYTTDRVAGKRIDAADSELHRAFADITIVVVASSTTAMTRNVCRAALSAGADYLDLQLSTPAKLAVLNELRRDIGANGRCFITDGGCHPGVPAAMVRYANTLFDTLEVANISAIFQLDWHKLTLSNATSAEFVDMLKHFNPSVLRQGQWVKRELRSLPAVDFGKPFGTRLCPPMLLQELRLLPAEIPSLRDTGFYIAGFNWATDYIVMPLAMPALKLFGDKAAVAIGKLFNGAVRTFSKPPFGAVMQLQASGISNNSHRTMTIRLSHDDAYLLTAAPVVACLLQYLNGDIRRPGLWWQANAVEPRLFFRDIERLGVICSVNRP